MSMMCNQNHTIGTWKREGRYLIIDCNCGRWHQKIDIDTPEAYEVFEVQSQVIIDGKE